MYCTASSVEMLCVDVVCFNSRSRFIVIYRPPHYGSNARDYENKLIESLESLCQVAWPVFIVGDLNCPGVNWQTNCAPLDGVQDKLLDCVVDYGFTQCVQLPTRGANVLDLVLVNEPLLLSSLSVLDPVGNSDHDSVQFCIAAEPKVIDNECAGEPVLTPHYIWQRADYEGISSYLSQVDWQSVMSHNLTTDSLWSSFCNILQCAVDLYVPTRPAGSPAPCSFIAKNPKRYPRVIRQAMGRKRCLWRLRRQHPADSNLADRYRTACMECRQLINDFEARRETAVVDSNNLGKFYRFVNKRLSCKSGVGALFDQTSNKTVLTDQGKANVLNDYFTSVGVKDNGKPLNISRDNSDGTEMDSIDFTPVKLLKVMRNVKQNSAPGPDGFPSSLLKNLAHCLAYPLSAIFSSFMSVGQLPQAWKWATVTPVFKGGIASNPSNYRPISLTSIFSKLN